MDVNRRVGDYEVLGELGCGGMGRVYRVRNVISDRQEAMKVLLPDLAGRQDLAARFIREIKLLATLNHPNIAALRTALTFDNQLVMIMELVEGEALSQRLARGPVPVPDALGYIDQVLDALDYAHGQNVVHRDIKPANMMLTAQGVVKLTDFGIARGRNDDTITVAGSTTGSLSYMSPEQVSGEVTDARSDLYSLGVSLYELVTGQRPFQAASDFSLMLAQLKEPPRPPIELRAALGPELNGVILKALAKAAAERFQSAQEFRRALRQVSGAFPPSREAVMLPIHGAAPSDPSALTRTAGAHRPLGAPHAGRVPAVQDPPGPLAPNVDPTGAAPVVHRERAKHPILYVALGGTLAMSLLAGTGYYLRRAEGGSSIGGAARPRSEATPPHAAGTSVPRNTGAPASGLSAPGTTEAAGAGTTPQTSGAVPPLPAEAPPAGQPPATAPLPESQARGKRAPGVPAAPPDPSRAGARSRALGSGAGGGAANGKEATGPVDQAQLRELVAEPPADQELDQLEADIDRLSARVSAANGNLDRMQQQQARQGWSMRGDIAARQQRMNASMSKAQDALEKGDAPRARRFRDSAAGEVEALERFLGR
jgi:serine/threonine-protein kinase